ncbi:MAG: hypothetical protein R2784_10240 [Saprospiraceae bacterium]
MAKKALVIGTETLSRVLDSYDRDSMIFSDGAGACVVESRESEEGASGILHTAVQSHTQGEAFYLYLGPSNFPGSDPRIRYIKMKGRKVYEYAMKNVPLAMKNCLDASGTDISKLKKVYLSIRQMKKWMKALSNCCIVLMVSKSCPSILCP